jgi:hypothetical protein
VLLAASFVRIGGERKPPFVPPLRALADAPLPVLAQVAKITPQELHALVGGDTRAQIRVLSQVLAAPGG